MTDAVVVVDLSLATTISCDTFSAYFKVHPGPHDLYFLQIERFLALPVPYWHVYS